jgi:hypothetical protein
MNTNVPYEILLGDEHDSALLAHLQAAVVARGGTFSESSYGVGGSQEVITYTIKLPSGTLEAISETYIGLVLRGSYELVRELSLAVRGA